MMNKRAKSQGGACDDITGERTKRRKYASNRKRNDDYDLVEQCVRSMKNAQKNAHAQTSVNPVNSSHRNGKYCDFYDFFVDKNGEVMRKLEERKLDKEREAKHAKHKRVQEAVLSCVEKGDVCALECLLNQAENQDVNLNYYCLPDGGLLGLHADNIVTRSLVNRAKVTSLYKDIKDMDFSPSKLEMIEFLIHRGLYRENYSLAVCQAYSRNKSYGILLPVIQDFTLAGRTRLRLVLMTAFENRESVEKIQLLLTSIRESEGTGDFPDYVREMMWCYEQDSECLQLVKVILNRYKEFERTRAEVCGFELLCYEAAVKKRRSREVLKLLCPQCPLGINWDGDDSRLLDLAIATIVTSAFDEKNDAAIMILYKNNWQFSPEVKTEHFQKALELKMRDLTHHFVERTLLDSPTLLSLAVHHGDIDVIWALLCDSNC